jgi:putative resolvase
MLRDPRVSWIVVEHRHRLARFGFEMVLDCPRHSGRRVVIVEDGEVTGHLVRDLLEILIPAGDCPAAGRPGPGGHQRRS